jgi:hypothetical protein
MCFLLMGWKDSVWEQRQIERWKNERDTNTAMDWAEKAWDLGSGVADGLKINNPMNMTGQYTKFKKSLYR